MATLVNYKIFVNEKEVPTKSEFYERLVKEAPFEYGDTGLEPKKSHTIKWLDPELIRQGQQFIRDNFFSIMFAHFISLMMIFCFKSGRSVLLRTGENHTKKNSIKRYLSTTLHIKEWYESSFIERHATTAQDVYAVRKMHGNAAKAYFSRRVPDIVLEPNQLNLLTALKIDLRNLPDVAEDMKRVLSPNPEVPMSQFDMVVTQFCFLGFIVINPKMFGIWNTEGISGFIHMWAVLGRLLGIDDKYNLALHYKDKLGYNFIWTNIFLPEFKTVDDYSIVMWDALVYGLQFYTLHLRLNAVLYFMIHDVALVEAKDAKTMFGLMTIYDRYCYFLMKFAIWMTRWNWFRFLVNYYERVSIGYAKLRYMRGGKHVTNPTNPVADVVNA